MRLFDTDRVGTYCDDIGHRVERSKDGEEVKMVDLTLRVQPFTPELAVSFDPDVRALLFTMNDAQPKPKIKAMEFRVPVPRQMMAVCLLPADDEDGAGVFGARVFMDVEISAPRARTEKGVDGYGLVFYASFGPVSKDDLEFVCNWHTQQRFVTFTPQQPALDFAGAEESDEAPLASRIARHVPKAH